MAACERKEEDGGSEWRQSMHNVCAFAIRYKVSIHFVKDPVLQDHHVITFYLGTSQYRPLSYRSPKGAKMMVRQRCGIMGARNGIHQSLYSIFDGKIPSRYQDFAGPEAARGASGIQP